MMIFNRRARKAEAARLARISNSPLVTGNRPRQALPLSAWPDAIRSNIRLVEAQQCAADCSCRGAN
jgi:hypothetical protein